MYYMHMYYSTDPGMVINSNFKVLALYNNDSEHKEL